MTEFLIGNQSRLCLLKRNKGAMNQMCYFENTFFNCYVTANRPITSQICEFNDATRAFCRSRHHVPQERPGAVQGRFLGGPGAIQLSTETSAAV